jgi:hypothetical protein
MMRYVAALRLASKHEFTPLIVERSIHLFVTNVLAWAEHI